MPLPWLARIAVGAAAVGGVALQRARRRARAARRIDFADRVVVITGGSRGLGLILARMLVTEGAHVTLVARTLADLERARAELRPPRDREVGIAVADVAEPGAMQAVIDGVVALHGRVDVLINAAGTIQVGPLAHMAQGDFARAVATHLWGPLRAIEAVLPVMRAQGEGRIVNISSIGGRVAVPHLAPYVASKFALSGLSDVVGDEVARDGVRVTTVVPGLMRTGSHVNVEVKGRHAAEYAWFERAIGAPLLSMDARRAAARILDACRHGDRHLTLGAPTRLAVLASAVAPELVAELRALVNRRLPTPAGHDGEARSGWASRAAAPPSILGRRADRAVVVNNELHGHAPDELERR